MVRLLSFVRLLTFGPLTAERNAFAVFASPLRFGSGAFAAFAIAVEQSLWKDSIRPVSLMERSGNPIWVVL